MAAKNRRVGFTLLEIMIALTIGSLVVGACIPSFLNWKSERALREPAGALGSLVQRARLDALTAGTLSEIRLAAPGFAYGKQEIALANGIRVRIKTSETAAWAPLGKATLGIHPSGLCDPWQLEFFSKDGSFLRTRIDPLTGFFEEQESYIR